MAKGFVYILRNEAMPGLLKIGHSVKVPTERATELFTTGVPEPFELAYYCLVEDAKKLEADIHRKLSEIRHRDGREFFRLELKAAIESIAALCTPEHEWRKEEIQPTIQYRENEPLRNIVIVHHKVKTTGFSRSALAARIASC